MDKPQDIREVVGPVPDTVDRQQAAATPKPKRKPAKKRPKK